jgi:DNA-binding transcriptional ArsR family regulator
MMSMVAGGEDTMIDPELIPLVAARFKALSEPGRLAILSALQDRERSVGELVETTGRGQPNVSQHLASLQRAGLVASRREANRVLYRLADPCLVRICKAVCESITKSATEQGRRLQALARSGSRRRA